MSNVIKLCKNENEKKKLMFNDKIETRCLAAHFDLI